MTAAQTSTTVLGCALDQHLPCHGHQQIAENLLILHDPGSLLWVVLLLGHGDICYFNGLGRIVIPTLKNGLKMGTSHSWKDLNLPDVVVGFVEFFSRLEKIGAMCSQ